MRAPQTALGCASADRLDAQSPRCAQLELEEPAGGLAPRPEQGGRFELDRIKLSAGPSEQARWYYHGSYNEGCRCRARSRAGGSLFRRLPSASPSSKMDGGCCSCAPPILYSRWAENDRVRAAFFPGVPWRACADIYATHTRERNTRPPTNASKTRGQQDGPDLLGIGGKRSGPCSPKSSRSLHRLQRRPCDMDHIQQQSRERPRGRAGTPGDAAPRPWQPERSGFM
jgi:hypothetical protein